MYNVLGLFIDMSSMDLGIMLNKSIHSDYSCFDYFVRGLIMLPAWYDQFVSRRHLWVRPHSILQLCGCWICLFVCVIVMDKEDMLVAFEDHIRNLEKVQ